MVSEPYLIIDTILSLFNRDKIFHMLIFMIPQPSFLFGVSTMDYLPVAGRFLKN